MDRLNELVKKYPQTKIWCDSALDEGIEYASAHGTVGITTNPKLMGLVLKEEFDKQKNLIRKVIKNIIPCGTAEEVTWEFVKQLCLEKSKVLETLSQETNGMLGRFTLQVNPTFFRNKEKLIAHAKELNRIRPNLQIKLPVTEAGIAAMEECTYLGISITATIALTVKGAIEAASAIERGLKRREAEGQTNEMITPYVAFFVRRFDICIKESAKNRGLDIPEEYFGYAGISVFKRCYNILKEQDYKARMMAGGVRSEIHWSELVGGDCDLTIPIQTLMEIDTSKKILESRIEVPVSEEIINKLKEVPEFNVAYEFDNQSLSDLTSFKATASTLKEFIDAYYEMVVKLSDIMIDMITND